jgi:hypothetical protein
MKYGVPTFGRSRDSEVAYQHAPVAVDHDVRALHIAMDDATLVRICERAGRGAEHVKRHRDGQWPLRLDDVLERTPLDELHRHEQETPCLSFAVHRDDAFVIQRRGEPRLALEPFGERLAERHLRRQYLDGDAPLESSFRGAVDDGH